MSDDINALDQAANQSRDHIWRVSFEANVFMDAEAEWTFDEVKVLAGADSQAAIDRVRDYVLDESEYGVKTIGFRVKDVKLLAEADIV